MLKMDRPRRIEDGSSSGGLWSAERAKQKKDSLESFFVAAEGLEPPTYGL